MTIAIGRPSGRVRMSRSMCRRSRAIPKRPSPARAKKISASARPWLVLPPANCAIELTAAPKLAGVDHGVPVWRDWNRNVGTQGRNARQHHRARHQAGRRAGPPLGPSPQNLPGQPERNGADEVEGPVVGVEEQRDDGPECDEIPRTGARQCPIEGEEPDHGEQGDQGVHAALRCRSGPRRERWRRGALRPIRRCGRRAGGRRPMRGAPSRRR